MSLADNVDSVRRLIELHTKQAEDETTCLRKGVAAIAGNCWDGEFEEIAVAYNGPSHPNIECTNEKGNCGCTHSEQKLIIDLAVGDNYDQSGEEFLLCNYSPCSDCANLIAYSGLFKYVIWNHLTLHDTRGLNILAASGVDHMWLGGLTFEKAPRALEYKTFYQSNREIINALT